MRRFLAITCAILLSLSGIVLSNAGETPSKAGTNQYFVNLKDGDTVSSPVTVVFGLSGMGVAPAGVAKKNTGHHHIFLDRPPLGQGAEGAEEFNVNIPADENHLHFGGGQTEKILALKPGKHTLQLVLADKDHIPHNPPVSSKVITITVK